MTVPHHSSDEQPDLRHVIADAVNELIRNQGYLGDQPAEPVTPDQVSIPCQRTLYSVETLNAKLNGGDLSACVALVSHGDDIHAWFFLTCRRAGKYHWQPVASVGGAHNRSGEPFLGKLRGPRSYVTIGSLYDIPDGGSIRIEFPDGSVHEDRAIDGCCIALAPVTFSPDIGEPTTIRYLDPDGSERGRETVRIGDGPLPPGVGYVS